MIKTSLLILFLAYCVSSKSFFFFIEYEIDESAAHQAKPLITQSKSLMHGINYKDCGSETGKIVDLAVTGCDKLPCIFQRGQNYSLQLNFNSLTNTKTVLNHVYGIIANIPIPFHLPNDDGCSMGVTCPVSNGQALTETVTLPILNEYPRISLFVKWSITDENNKQMVCFTFPVKIQ